MYRTRPFALRSSSLPLFPAARFDVFRAATFFDEFLKLMRGIAGFKAVLSGYTKNICRLGKFLFVISFLRLVTNFFINFGTLFHCYWRILSALVSRREATLEFRAPASTPPLHYSPFIGFADFSPAGYTMLDLP